MAECPKCRQSIDPRAIACPFCRTELKAFGHPGIPLSRSVGDESLCASCTYHADNTCTFPQRPHAKTCTLYRDQSQPETDLPPRRALAPWHLQVKIWCQRHPTALMLLGLAIASFLLALYRR